MNTFILRDDYKRLMNVYRYNNKCCFLIYFDFKIEELEEVLLTTSINNKKILKKSYENDENDENNVNVIKMKRIDYNTIDEGDINKKEKFTMISLYFDFN